MNYIQTTEECLQLAKSWLENAATPRKDWDNVLNGHSSSNDLLENYTLVDAYHIKTTIPNLFNSHKFKRKIEKLLAEGGDIDTRMFFNIYSLAKRCWETYSKDVVPLQQQIKNGENFYKDLDNAIITTEFFYYTVYEKDSKLFLLSGTKENGGVDSLSYLSSEDSTNRILTLQQLAHYADDVLRSLKGLADWEEMADKEKEKTLAIGKWQTLDLMSLYLSRLDQICKAYSVDGTKVNLQSYSITKNTVDEYFENNSINIKKELQLEFYNLTPVEKTLLIKKIKTNILNAKGEFEVIKNNITIELRQRFNKDVFFSIEGVSPVTGEFLLKYFEDKMAIFEREFNLFLGITVNDVLPTEPTKPQKPQLNAKIKIGFTSNVLDEDLETLYNKLTNLGKLEGKNLLKFKSLFRGKAIKNQLIWLGSIFEMKKLVKSLAAKKIIETSDKPKDYYTTANNCFVDEDGNTMDVAKSRPSSGKDESDAITAICEEVAMIIQEKEQKRSLKPKIS